MSPWFLSSIHIQRLGPTSKQRQKFLVALMGLITQLSYAGKTRILCWQSQDLVCLWGLQPERTRDWKIMFCGSPLKQPDRELKKEVPGWGNKSVSYIQHTLHKRHKRLSFPSRSAARKPLWQRSRRGQDFTLQRGLHWTKKDIGEKTLKINYSRVGQPRGFFCRYFFLVH
jgi:hypothetical protein